MMWQSSIFIQPLYLLFLMCLFLRPARCRTIDEIIAGSSNAVTDFDFMGDITGNVVRVELDMMMTLQQYQALYSKQSTSALSRKKRKAIKPETHRWTKKEIPYRIDNSAFSAADLDEVNKAIHEWENYTCISFRRATSTDSNFVNFEDGTGCSSYVGMNGGKHPIALASGCRQKGVIIHEIGHAVGFYHEQNRPDRDDYIIIQADNIIHPNLNHNFQKYPWSAVSSYNVSYDYRSIMHYGGRAFSGNGQYTIKTKNPAFQEIIGNREGLSFNDIKLANLMYSCNEKCNPNIVCPGDGFVGKNCQCLCRGNPIQKCSNSESKVTTQSPTVKPTETITTQPLSATCIDMNTNCPGWANAGYCLTNNYVKTYCKDSCTLCPECRDVREHCQSWKEQGHCTGGVYQNFVTEKCPLTCGICKIGSRYSGGIRKGSIEVGRDKNVTVTGDVDNGVDSASSSLILILAGVLFLAIFT